MDPRPVHNRVLGGQEHAAAVDRHDLFPVISLPTHRGCPAAPIASISAWSASSCSNLQVAGWSALGEHVRRNGDVESEALAARGLGWRRRRCERTHKVVYGGDRVHFWLGC